MQSPNEPPLRFIDLEKMCPPLDIQGGQVAGQLLRIIPLLLLTPEPPAPTPRPTYPNPPILPSPPSDRSAWIRPQPGPGSGGGGAWVGLDRGGGEGGTKTPTL